MTDEELEPSPTDSVETVKLQWCGMMADWLESSTSNSRSTGSGVLQGS